MTIPVLKLVRYLNLEAGCDIENVYCHDDGGYTVQFTDILRPAVFVPREAIYPKAKAQPAIAQPKTVVKPIIRKQPIPVVKPECEVYRVVKTWDNGGWYSAGRVISVLIQPVDYSEKPFWESVMLSQGIERNDILKRGRGRCLVKADLSYVEAIATYA